jgi:tRNA threonylcarbamoyladenosine biosynthesis protein TsaB
MKAEPMKERLLLIETSDRPGFVALAEGNRLLGERRLDLARRHARDLAPVSAELLAELGWKARDLAGVVVSRGPGSYTGLRVGIISAKTLAYALGCRLLAIDTFAAIARQAPASATAVEVIADAQQDKVYAQRFTGPAAHGAWHATDPLCILPFADWIAQLKPGVTVSGPGLEGRENRLPTEVAVAPSADWRPRVESLLSLGWERWQRGESDDVYALEPLYLRPSAAEEKWRAKK